MLPMLRKFLQKFDILLKEQKSKDNKDYHEEAYIEEVKKRVRKSRNGRFTPNLKKEEVVPVMMLIAGGAFPFIGINFEHKARGISPIKGRVNRRGQSATSRRVA